MALPGTVFTLREVKIVPKAPTVDEIHDFIKTLFSKACLSSECSLVSTRDRTRDGRGFGNASFFFSSSCVTVHDVCSTGMSFCRTNRYLSVMTSGTAKEQDNVKKRRNRIRTNHQE